MPSGIIFSFVLLTGCSIFYADAFPRHFPLDSQQFTIPEEASYSVADNHLPAEYSQNPAKPPLHHQPYPKLSYAEEVKLSRGQCLDMFTDYVASVDDLSAADVHAYMPTQCRLLHDDDEIVEFEEDGLDDTEYFAKVYIMVVIIMVLISAFGIVAYLHVQKKRNEARMFLPMYVENPLW